MHILYIHQHFATPKGSTGTRSYEFARRWVQAGHRVTLLTGHCDVSGLELGRGLIQRRTIEGIDLLVVGTGYSNKQSYLRRLISFLCFIVVGTYAALRTRGVDVVYATSTPLTVGIPAMIVKWARHKPFVFEVRDQWPEIPIELGIIKNGLLARMLLRLEKKIYRNSSSIVALSPGQADGIRKVLSADRPITVIPNCCDTDVFKPDIDGSAFRRRRGWQDKLVFLHAGAMGKVNALDFVIDAAEKLTEHDDILFVLVGDGNQRPSLESRVKELGLTNVEILPPVAKENLPEIIAASDVCMVVIGKYPIIEHNSANKFFDALSSGKPVLLNYSGWQREILQESKAGFGCELCNLDEFVGRVLYFRSHREQARQMGRNARRIAEERFDRDRLAAEALSVLQVILNPTDHIGDSRCD
jgi:glycosyltransferase involved in cell wall biosynthesis